ncbi:MAG: FadR family transcriptional regulator [Firmicutes bacterium HGW-Firmicutes-16]|nr:MAG: FadR family transcriptional regulator [Firmicutes bacterium HGW-Firmicutes-16]
MEFSRLNAPSLKELFIEHLEKMILSGKLVIGEKLPSERELAESMHISRSVVNAGLAEIADKGFLEIIPRSGTYVADYHKKGKLDTLVSIMKFNGGTLPDADILSILQIRKVLTALALDLAMPRITDDEVKQLFKHSALLDKTNDSTRAAELVFEFDHLLCGFSGNTLLPLIFYSFKAPNTTLFERFFRLYGFDAMRRRTDALCHAIRARDLVTAKEVLARSIEETISGSTRIYR